MDDEISEEAELMDTDEEGITEELANALVEENEAKIPVDLPPSFTYANMGEPQLF